MKKILIIAGVIVLVVLLIVVGLVLFKGGELLKIGVEKSLLMARSQVEKALPETYAPDKIRKEFDAVLNNVRAGQINTGNVKNLLLWMPTVLEDSKLDSMEVDSLIQRLHKISEVKQK